MTNNNYRSLNLTLQPSNIKTYRAQLRRARNGVKVDFDVEPAEIGEWLAEEDGAAYERAMEFGWTLYSDMIGRSGRRPGSPYAVFERLQIPGAKGQPVHISLRLHLAADRPKLTRLPWEYLNTHEYNRPFVTSRGGSLARSVWPLPAERDTLPPVALGGKLRVGVVADQPEEIAGNIRQVTAELEQARWWAATFELNHSDLAGLAGLSRRVDVLHLSGQAVYNEAGEGCLRLGGQTFNAEELVGLLQAGRGAGETDTAGPRLLVIEQTGPEPIATLALSDLAFRLVRDWGRSAVVAGQHSFSREAAGLLWSVFYDTLGFGERVDVALGEARYQLYNRQREGLAWGFPALYLTRDSRLFSPQAEHDKNCLNPIRVEREVLRRMAEKQSSALVGVPLAARENEAAAEETTAPVSVPPAPSEVAANAVADNTLDSAPANLAPDENGTVPSVGTETVAVKPTSMQPISLDPATGQPLPTTNPTHAPGSADSTEYLRGLNHTTATAAAVTEPLPPVTLSPAVQVSTGVDPAPVSASVQQPVPPSSSPGRPPRQPKPAKTQPKTAAKTPSPPVQTGATAPVSSSLASVRPAPTRIPGSRSQPASARSNLGTLWKRLVSPSSLLYATTSLLVLCIIVAFYIIWLVTYIASLTKENQIVIPLVVPLMAVGIAVLVSVLVVFGWIRFFRVENIGRLGLIILLTLATTYVTVSLGSSLLGLNIFSLA